MTAMSAPERIEPEKLTWAAGVLDDFARSLKVETYPGTCFSIGADACRRVITLAAEKEALERERNEFRRRWEEACRRSGKHEFRAEAAEARVRELEAALRTWIEAKDALAAFANEHPDNSGKVWRELFDELAAAEDAARAALTQEGRDG